MQTSLTAWAHVKKDLSARQAEVLDAIKKLHGRATMHSVEWYLKKPLHTFSGRFSELEKKGMIRRAGVHRSKDAPPRTIWEVI